MKPVTSFGRLVQPFHDISYLHDRHQLLDLKGHAFGLPYGMGRSYGDVCLNTQGLLWQTRGLDRFIAFDKASGKLTCEAGVLLSEIQRLVMPHGWTLPVTPGTQWVTVGGAIANDIHGKNHTRRGTFGEHIRYLRLMRTDGSELRCSLNQNTDWLRTTIGGVGLTGVIVEAEIQLCAIQSAFLETQVTPFHDIATGIALAEQAALSWEHVVVWLDSTKPGWGLLMQGKWSDWEGVVKTGKVRQLPPVPCSLIHPCSIKPLNWLYYQHKKRMPRYLPYTDFLYPLDGIVNWNAVYGPKGFYQYQAVVDKACAEAVLKEMMQAMHAAQHPASLATLKLFAERKPAGLLSFAKTGVTFAFDFPNQGEKTRALLKRFDTLILEARGRVYLAKDASMSRDLFEAGYPEASIFLRYKDLKIRSDLYQRLMS